MLVELLRTAKAKQQQELGPTGGVVAGSLQGSGSSSDGELLEAGETGKGGWQ